MKQIAQCIFQGNLGCSDWGAGRAPGCFSKGKHMDRTYNYVMSMIEEKVVKLVLLRTEKMEADYLSKRPPR